MEVIYNYTIRNADELLRQRLAHGAITVSEPALYTAINHIREQKEIAVDTKNFVSLASWRETEKQMLTALGGFGLDRPAAIQP